MGHFRLAGKPEASALDGDDGDDPSLARTVLHRAMARVTSAKLPHGNPLGVTAPGLGILLHVAELLLYQPCASTQRCRYPTEVGEKLAAAILFLKRLKTNSES